MVTQMVKEGKNMERGKDRRRILGKAEVRTEEIKKDRQQGQGQGQGQRKNRGTGKEGRDNENR